MSTTKISQHVIGSGAITASHVSNITTANITENTNLYHTSARARGAISVTGGYLSYDSGTGVIQLTFSTPASSSNDTTPATTAFVGTAIANVIGGAPGTLDTLNELAAAINDDASYASTLTTALATKAPLASPTFTTTITTPDINITGGSQIGQDYAYLKSNSTTTASLTLRKDSTGADSIDFLQLRSDGNGLIGKIEGDGDISFKAATFTGTVTAPTLITGAYGASGSAGDGFRLNSTDLYGQVDASDKVRIAVAGNSFFNGGYVGIGTSSPRYNLTVAGNSTTAIGIGVDNASGSSTLDIAALGTGYNNHQAAAGEVWFFSPDNINIGGATGHTNDIKFLANNSVNMIIKGANGNVGIGNTDPNKPFTVTSDSGANCIGLRARPADDYSFIQFFNNAGSALRGQIYSHSSGDIGFTTGTDSSAGNDLYIKNGTGVGIGTNDTYSRKFAVEGTGDLMLLRSTNSGAGGAQLDLMHDSASYADGDSVGIVNFATDDRQLTSIKGVGAASGERGVFHIGVRKSSSEYNHNAMRLHNSGNEVLLDIYAPSGSNRGAGYFRFKTDGASTEESVAQIYMEQGSGDGGSRKSAMYFQVADNGAPSTAMTIENNKYISTAEHLNVATSTPQSSSKLTVNGGIRFNHFSAGHGLNCVANLSFNNSSVANACGTVYYKMFILNLYHNNGHSQTLFLANGGGGVGFRFTTINAGDNTIRNGIVDFNLTTIGSAPNTFRIQISNGGGALTVSRTSGTGSFGVNVMVLAGG